VERARGARGGWVGGGDWVEGRGWRRVPRGFVLCTHMHFGAIVHNTHRPTKVTQQNRAVKIRLSIYVDGSCPPALPSTPGEAAEQKPNDGHARIRMGTHAGGHSVQRGMPRQNLESAYRLGTSFFAALLVPRAQKNGQVAADVCVWRHCVDVGG